MTEATIRANETTVPVMSCTSVDEMVEFYGALGFETTYRQEKPYLYLALKWSGFELHFGKPPANSDPGLEDAGGCLVMVDAVAPYHAALVRAMREAYGKVLATGRPRITRYRTGASRFTLVDPSGNSIIFIQRNEPEEVEYGGSKRLAGLAKVLDNGRIYREFKNDDLAAFRAVKSGLRKYGEEAPAIDLARALATLIDLATLHDEHHKDTEAWIARLGTIPLSEQQRDQIAEQLGNPSGLRYWLAGEQAPAASAED